MSDLVELLNNLNQGNRIEYSDYSQLMFCVQQLEKENAVLKNIILDAMVGQAEFCLLCENKGQNLPECKRMKEEDCLQHLVELYKGELAE